MIPECYPRNTRMTRKKSGKNKIGDEEGWMVLVLLLLLVLGLGK